MKATIILAIAAAFTGQALAQTAAAPAAAPEAGTSVQTTAPSISEKLGVSAQVVGWGPAVGSPREGDYKGSRLPNVATGFQEGGDSAFTENLLKVKYKIDDKWSVAPVFYSTYHLNEGNGNNEKFVIEDSWISLANSSLFKSGDFNLAGELRTYLPMSDKSQDLSQVVMFRQNMIASYDIGRFTLQGYGYLRYHQYSKRLDKQNNMKAYFGPEVDYTITPTLKATFLYEMAATQARGDTLVTWNNAGTDFEPGLSWDATKYLNISPFLDIKTGERISLDTTTANISVTVTML